MKKFIPSVCFLWLCLMPALCFSQDNGWVMGEWQGGYFGEKSKLTKKFDSRLQITKVNGNVFEGVVQCILPTDTTIRLHTRISGRIYPNYLMTKLKEVVYFKDPPGQYTWAKHCFTCDSMKLTMVKKGDSIVLNGERRCDTLCNIIARYTKNTGATAQKTPPATKPDKGFATRTSLEMELAPPTAAPNKMPETVGAKTSGTSNTVQKTAGSTVNAGKVDVTQAAAAPSGKDQVQKTGAPSNAPGKTLPQQIAATGIPSVPGQQTTAASNAPGKIPVQQTTATGSPSVPVQQTMGAPNATGKTPVQQTAATGNPSSPVQQTAARTVPLSKDQNQPTTPSGTSPNKPDEQASLGNQTPGIDRDNVFSASMPVRSGGNAIIFARPVLRDSLSANYIVAGRSVTTSARFTVYADTAEVILMDNGIVDGDTVSLYYNSQIIVQKQELKIKPFSIKVPVYRGGVNVLTVYAESLGIYPPNTAYVKLICGDKETSFLLSSTMSKSSSIELYRSDTNSY